ncbi:MAG TPA: type II toxin-antitoxin system HicB family antitoxin [Candidatus Diapherotrites archaeon]|uniref:Type II toxin-antitoxin system HicB family antitoxin n=1 Tax=Candidatus Iainarchaeum sp. TaxID=3101447 RepID=A0A7J4J5G9_9ARCH|nr:type II toxin-antitoxin system HicB family antitoxin [Candidatus Diapherotrites archaeon]
MQKKKAYNFLVLIEQDSNGWYVAKVPDIQGCHTQGKTVAQVMERIKEAIRVCLEADDLEPSTSKFVGVQNVEIRV